MNKLSVTALILGSGLALAGTVLAGSGGSDCADGKGEGKAAHRMTQLDTNKDGKVNLTELLQSKQTWLRDVDANKDGAATRAEIDASFQARRTQHVKELFEKQDANKDGKLSRDESHMPPRWFARVDANADGNLTREEMTQRPGRGDGVESGKLARMDVNSDGKVDAAELKTAAELMLKRLDQNSDAVLDAGELARHGRHGGHGGHDKGTPNKDLPAGATRS